MTRSPARRSTSSTRGCCSTTCPSGSRCCGACGTRSPRAATCSCRTTTCAASARCRRSRASRSSAASIVDAFAAAGCDVHVGARLPELFARAGIGAPDGTDVSGRLEPLVDAHRMLDGVYRGSAADRDRARHHDRGARRGVAVATWRATSSGFPSATALWPLLIGAWKRKPAVESEPRDERQLVEPNTDLIDRIRRR